MEQYVCRICGYNLIGYFPDKCPFCGASNDNFVTAEFCSEKYMIVEEKITNRVSSLKASPKLGLEHYAYCILTEKQRIWIDCPAIFQNDLE